MDEETKIQTSEEETDEVKPETEIKPAQPSQPTAPAVDYEKKFKDSQRENDLLRDANQQRERTEQESTKEPTDSDLKTAFPEWDTLSDFEKKIARDNLVTKRLASSAVKTTQELTSERAWNTSIELAVSSDPALQGKEHAFRQFALQPKYRGASMELLVSAFLQKNPVAPTTTTPKPGLERGSGGPRTPEKPKLLSATDLATLRKTDEKAYFAYVQTHDIKLDEME